MRRPDDALFVDMLVHVRRVGARLEGVPRSQFDADEVLQSAVAYWLQVIGEAANRLSPEQRAAHDEVPWRDVIGMRHVIVHDYFRLDLDVVWQVAHDDVPALATALERIVGSLESESGT